MRDTAKRRFIWAGLHVERKPTKGVTYGSMDIATGIDGSADTLLLPPGEYLISVERFSCQNSQYFTTHPPSETLTVKEGQRLMKDISVDVRRIKPAPSFSNPHGKPCKRV